MSFLIFPSEEFFPQRLVNTAFYSPTVGATCFLLSKSFSSFTFLSISEVDEKNIESEVSNQEEWGSGDVYDGSSPIIRKMGEKRWKKRNT